VSIPDDGNPGGKVTTDNGSSSSRNAAHDNILVMEPEEKEQQKKKQKSKRRLSKKEALKKSIEEDIEASERSWAEASQGILVFEEEGSESNDPVSAAKETEDELNASQHLMQMEAPPDVSRFRHVSPKLHKYAKPLQWENALIGISIAGFDIGTSQGPIADSVWLEENGEQWEVLAQPKTSSGQQRRKICLPEQVYPQAHVALEGHGVWLSWDAMDALRTWAVCHQNIAINSREPSEGVSVLESKDAKLWEGRRKHGTTEEGSSVFHYDWTYSTPFNVKTEGGEWVELDESGMRMDLLTDQSVPILFFDEIILFEDDLHDNGQVQFSIKLRVMPTCAYVLARMWIRVDRVLCRLRETRVLIDFFGLQPHIYRDITWRECRWEDMSARGLPDSIKSWNCYSDTGATSAQWHELIQKLPEVDLPKGYMPHAVLEYGS
jgi:type 2A phosphatase activator TIP41